MEKKKLLKILDEICPFDTQEEWDNSGVQIEIGYKEADRALIALEVTDEVIDEAMNASCPVIITHHPLIFGGLDAIEADDPTGRYVERLIRAGISVYSCHTPFDKAIGGLNDYFGKLVDLGAVKRSADNDYVRYADLKEERFFGDLLKDIADKLSVDLRLFRAEGDPEKKVKRAAWCTGSGAEFIRDAYKLGADMYITGDLKYHDAMRAKALGIAVLDAGHYGTEKIFVDDMCGLLSDKADIELIKSKIDIDPFSW